MNAHRTCARLGRLVLLPIVLAGSADLAAAQQTDIVAGIAAANDALTGQIAATGAALAGTRDALAATEK